jgi:hypothetical protein
MSYIENVNLTNTSNQPINPATEETVLLLKRLLHLANSLATQDSAQRQKVTIDSITGSLTLSTITTVGTVTTCGTVTNVTNMIGLGGGTGFSVDSRYLLVDTARNNYANSIRSKITF